MKYDTVKDILPEILEATEAKKLKWEEQGPDDFFVRVDGYRIEIELRDDDKIVDGILLKASVLFYLWSKEGKILDSYYARKGTPDFAEYLSYFEAIRRSCINIPEILSEIVAKVKSM